MITFLAVVLAGVALMWGADRWLESADGRELLEDALSDKLGLPVSLGGEFDLVLLPLPGVSGTDLIIGGLLPGWSLVHSGAYTVSVTPASIWNYRQPEIRQLQLRDTLIRIPGREETLTLDYLSVSDYVENRDTPFSLSVDSIGRADGEFRWQPAGRSVHFRELTLDTEGGAIRGGGCVDLGPPLSAQLSLDADTLDLDAIFESLPASTGGAPAPPTDLLSDGLSFDLRLRLTADTLRSAGVTAYGASVELGETPDCRP